MVLKWNGEYLINHVILAMKDVVDRVIVVTGYYHYDIVKAVERFDDVTVIRNEAYQNGMFSSIKTGVRLVEGDFFIIPGDYPLIDAKVYQLLINKTGEIRVPTFNGYKGHPIFIEKQLKNVLLEFDDNSNLKVFRNSKDVSYYATDCEGILKDIDTIEDYKTMIERND